METFSESPKRALCPGCGHPNSETDHFCAACSAPLTAHAATDPMGSIFAQGYALGKGVSRPGHPIVVVGLWLLALPLLLLNIEFFPLIVGELVQGLVQLDIGQVLGGLVGVTLMSLFLAIYVGIAYKSTRNYLRSSHQPQKAKPTTDISARPMSRADDGQTCLACGQTIPTAEKQCPDCGWSWNGSSGA